MIGFYEYLIHTVLLSLIILYLLYDSNFYRIHKFFKTIPTPPTKLFLGHLHEIKSPSAFLQILHKYAKQYGKKFHLKMGPFKHILVISDPSFIHYALNNKAFKKTQVLGVLRPWIGNGLPISDGDIWKTHRRVITPAFGIKILQKFVAIFETCSDVLVANLSKVAQKGNVDIYPYIYRCTFDMICETSMGTKPDAQINKSSKYFQCASDVCRITYERMISGLKRYNIAFYFTKDYDLQKQNLRYLHEYADRVIDDKLETLEHNKTDQGVEENKKKMVFLDAVLASSFKNEEFSHDDVRDEVSTFMFAGHHTTASATSFTLYCLAYHGSIQDKLYREQQQIFGNVKNPEVTYSNLQEMHFLECAIKESMRLYPPITMISRDTSEEVNYNGTSIPKGVQVGFFVHGIHMNPEYFPDPEKFDPSRFENADEKQYFTYLPFGTGPRNCIGQKFAMLEMKCLIAKIVRNFELAPASPEHVLDLTIELVLKPANGVEIGLRLR